MCYLGFWVFMSSLMVQIKYEKDKNIEIIIIYMGTCFGLKLLFGLI